ncbi:MAG: hypothetical protein ACOCWM_04135 [Cyclobacteriaceae bacterium]
MKQSYFWLIAPLLLIVVTMSLSYDSFFKSHTAQNNIVNKDSIFISWMDDTLDVINDNFKKCKFANSLLIYNCDNPNFLFDSCSFTISQEIPYLRIEKLYSIETAADSIKYCDEPFKTVLELVHEADSLPDGKFYLSFIMKEEYYPSAVPEIGFKYDYHFEFNDIIVVYPNNKNQSYDYMYKEYQTLKLKIASIVTHYVDVEY